MADFYGYHFKYAGIDSRDKHLMFARIDRGDFDMLSGEIEGITVFNKKNKKRYLVDDDYSGSPISTEVEIVRDDDEAIPQEDRKAIEKWLFNRSAYQKLYFDAADDCDGEYNIPVFESFLAIRTEDMHVFSEIAGDLCGWGAEISLFTPALQAKIGRLYNENFELYVDGFSEPMQKHILDFYDAAVYTLNCDSVPGTYSPVDPTKDFVRLIIGEEDDYIGIESSWDNSGGTFDFGLMTMTNPKRWYMNCRFVNAHKIEGNGGVVGYSATLEADSGYMWMDEEVSFNLTDAANGESVTVSLDSAIDDYTYPLVTVKMGSSAGGDFTIVNQTDSRSRQTKFEGISAGATVVFGGDENYVSSYTTNDPNAEYSYYPKFVGCKFVRLCDGDNILTVTGNVSEIKFNYAHRKFM